VEGRGKGSGEKKTWFFFKSLNTFRSLCAWCWFPCNWDAIATAGRLVKIFTYHVSGSCRKESEMSVVVGEHDLKKYDESQVRHHVAHAKVHDKYATNPTRYDIMLLRLNTSIQYNDQTSPICVDETQFTPGTRCWITGWGSTDHFGRYC